MSKLDWEKANQNKGSSGKLAIVSSHYEAAMNHAIARKKRMAREAAQLRKHKADLAQGNVPAFNQGIEQGKLQERERIVDLLQNLRNQAQERKLPQTANINNIITLIKGTLND